MRCIAARLGRAPSTVCREVACNGGRYRYRALTAHRTSRHRVRRRKPAKLASNHRLREVVEEKLELWWSPTQISEGLIDEYGDTEGMRVSHETIYQSLFIQGKGALRKELWRCLRTGRARRRPQGRPASTKGQIRDMVMISERPAEVEDRAVSWSLGRRPSDGETSDRHRDSGGTLVAVCDAVPATRRQHRRSSPECSR